MLAGLEGLTMIHKSLKLELKQAQGEGVISARASVYGVVDSYGDVVVNGAFSRTLRENGADIVVLYQHDPSNPIGRARLTDKADGLHAEIRLELELQSARDAYTRVKGGLVDGVSIGFECVRESFKSGNRLIEDVNLWEISLVTFPACAPARVTGVKNDGEVIEKLAERLAATNRALRDGSENREVQSLEALSRGLRAFRSKI
jgi:HK97 family phage prohead protease